MVLLLNAVVPFLKSKIVHFEGISENPIFLDAKGFLSFDQL